MVCEVAPKPKCVWMRKPQKEDKFVIYLLFGTFATQFYATSYLSWVCAMAYEKFAKFENRTVGAQKK